MRFIAALMDDFPVKRANRAARKVGQNAPHSLLNSQILIALISTAFVNQQKK